MTKVNLEVGKTYKTVCGRTVKIIYKSDCRATPFLGILQAMENFPDDEVWYNPDGTTNCDIEDLELEIVSDKVASINAFTLRILSKELDYAREKHPEFAKDMAQALLIAQEELGEAIQAYNNNDRDNMNRELAQTAAVIIRILNGEVHKQNGFL